MGFYFFLKKRFWALRKIPWLLYAKTTLKRLYLIKRFFYERNYSMVKIFLKIVFLNTIFWIWFGKSDILFKEFFNVVKKFPKKIKMIFKFFKKEKKNTFFLRKTQCCKNNFFFFFLKMNFLKHIRTSNVVKAFLKTFFILFWTQFFGFGLKSQKFFLKAFFNMVKTFPKKKTWFSDFFLRKSRKYIFWRKTQCGKNSFFFFFFWKWIF